MLQQSHTGENVVFDFGVGLISILPPRQRMRDEQGTIVVRGNLRQGHLIVTRATANRVPPMAILATGSVITMGNAALRHALWARRRLGPVELVLDVGDRRNIGRGRLPDEEDHNR